MNILLSNDDGIHAPGLRSLYEALKPLADKITVVAPDKERSASGHGITLKQPLRIHKVPFADGSEQYATTGTPVDCVKLALQEILDDKPDLLVSGINFGGNTGINIIYSGTVAAAVEGALYEIPSIAVSLTTYQNPLFETPCRLIFAAVELFKQGQLDLSNALLNINVPNLAWDQLTGLELTCQGPSRFEEEFERRCDPFGEEYFWMTGEKKILTGPDHSDEKVIPQGKISVTPLHYDMSDYASVDFDSHVSRRQKAEQFVAALSKVL